VKKAQSRSEAEPAPRSVEPLVGLGGSPGFATGPAWVVDVEQPGVVHRRVEAAEVSLELARFHAAVAEASADLRDVIKRAKKKSLERSIVETYVLMVQDETLRKAVERKVRGELQCAEWALDTTIREMSTALRQKENAYLAERSHDIEFVGKRLLDVLTGKRTGLVLPEGEQPFVLVARDLSPAETAGLSKERVLALVTEGGTRTSHTAILARALQIPAVVGVPQLLSQVVHGETLVVDGFRGVVTLHPTAEQIFSAREREERYLRLATGLTRSRSRPATTRCGVPVILRANIELPSEAKLAIESGAQGIGLYRTEFLYVDRHEPPSEDEQYETYREVVEALAPHPVTLRTFDIGGDKFASHFLLPHEMNPALGLRAVRLGLERPELFLAQLRAMVRASAHGKLRVMIPMIAALGEYRQVKALLARAIAEVGERGQPCASEIPLGMMVEVPSAAVLSAVFAKHAAFLSVGTNDLVQYTLAVDRGSQRLVKLGSFFDPAVLRLISTVLHAGEAAGKPVSLCGTMASDPLSALLLVGMGLRELSMEASAIGAVKEAIFRVSVEEAERVYAECALLEEAEQVEGRLTQRFGSLVGDLVDGS
jgi:phosphotransferase system enzyme I (PtsI)